MVRVRQGSRARPEIPVVRTISSQPDYIVAQGEILDYCLVILPPPGLYLYLQGPNTQQLSSHQGESGSSLVAQIEKIKTFIAAANTSLEKTESHEGGGGGGEGDGLYWADIVLIDQNDKEENSHIQSSQSPVSSRTQQTNKRKSWLQENFDFVQLDEGESLV